MPSRAAAMQLATLRWGITVRNPAEMPRVIEYSMMAAVTAL